MPRQIGLDALEYECAVLTALNQKDRFYIEAELEIMHIPKESKESLLESYLSVISKRDKKISFYTQKLDALRKDHDPRSSLLCEDSYECLYQEFLATNLSAILMDIERYYDSEIQNLLTQGVVHFTLTAKRIAKYNLYHHGIDSIVSKKLNASKLKKIDQALMLVSERWLKKYSGNDISQIISAQYNYFYERIDCCLDIGNKVRSL